ncbi:MAG: protein-export chaperone SecB [Prevotella sp.]|jgi:preprotein translocase subunit SecB|nr:protein-export chaperone SecB [Prevotella sp.]
MEEVRQAAFKLENYHFSKVEMNLDVIKSGNIDVDFIPSGIYRKDKGIFELTFDFKANFKNSETPFIDIQCKSSFSFVNVKSLSEIPPFFYANSIAILFPYIRAFVSTITLQANLTPLILPTYNLTSLESKFSGNVIEE